MADLVPNRIDDVPGFGADCGNFAQPRTGNLRSHLALLVHAARGAGGSEERQV